MRNRFVVFIFFLFTSTNFVWGNHECEKSNEKHYQTVYVCTGSYAYAYHSRNNCSGLNNCKGEIRYTDEYNAQVSMHRKPCCICWSDVQNNCAQDGQAYGGGGSGGSGAGYAMIAVAAAVAVASLFILSNEIRISGVASFYEGIPIQKVNNRNVTSYPGGGFSIMLRKDFKHGGLEYGGGLIAFNRTEVYNNYYGNQYIRREQKLVGNVCIDYVHFIAENRMKQNLKVFIGPLVKYRFDDANNGIIYNFGFGVTTGLKFQFHDRIALDFRYEITHTTNQLSLGIQFLYQKKYFWQRNK